MKVIYTRAIGEYRNLVNIPGTLLISKPFSLELMKHAKYPALLLTKNISRSYENFHKIIS